MSFSITIRVYQTNGDNFFRIAEQTAWKNAVGWSTDANQHILNLGTSKDTSGTLRFISSNGESFILAVGVYNGQRWCDIVPDLQADQTGVIVNPEYYDPVNYPAKVSIRKSVPDYFKTVDLKQRSLSVLFTANSGQDLQASLFIG
jgi:hypothetical protein